MLDLPSDHGAMHRFELREQVRTVRRGSRSTLSKLDATIILTSPLAIPLTDALIGKDEELAAFWAKEKGRYRYDYVTFRCDLGAAAEKPFQTVWVEVGLEAAHEEGETMAWSVAPKLLEDSRKTKTMVKLGAKFSMFSPEVASEAEAETKQWSLRARGEHTTRPYWELRATDKAVLEGTYGFHLVVRSTAGVPVAGSLSARAVVADRTFLIFVSESELDQPASVAFTLPASGA